MKRLSHTLMVLICTFHIISSQLNLFCGTQTFLVEQITVNNNEHGSEQRAFCENRVEKVTLLFCICTEKADELRQKASMNQAKNKYCTLGE